MGLTQQDIDEIAIAFDRNGALNNIEIREAFQKILDSGSGSAAQIFVGVLSQTGTNAPVITSELINTLEFTPLSTAYNSVGIYSITADDDNFLSGKVFLTSSSNDARITLERTGDDEITMRTRTAAGTLANDILNGDDTLIKIEVYS